MNRLSTAVAIVLALFSVHDTATSQIPPKREFRAAWVASVTNLDWPSPAARGANSQVQKDELTSLLDKLKATGISAIVFQIRPECDALYNSPYDPWSYWLTGVQGTPPNPYYDPLEFAVAEAHRRGMELHAWFNPYRAERSVSNYPTASTHVTNLHPAWILYFPTTKLKILDPGLPQVRDYVAGVVADIVRRYDVDGIHADDYFYPYDPIISTEDAATFQNYSRGFTNIGDWRRDNVNLLMRMLSDSIRGIKPWVKIGMSPFGIWKSGVPPGIFGLDAYNEIYGDAMAWLDQGTVDYLAPQLYWPFGGGQDYAKLMPWWADSTAAHNRHLYIGQGAYRIGSWSAVEMPNQMRANRGNSKVGGSVFFRANNGITDNLKGFADSLKQNFYRYPALHPIMAWKDVVPPYPPRAIRYASLAGTSISAIQWDLPNPAPDGDSASRYAVYRFDHRPTASELDDARNLVSIEGQRFSVPARPPVAGPAYFVVTALDRNYNESDTSNILMITPPPAPLLASPADGATSVPESVVVAWRPVAGITSYHLQVSSDPTFATGVIWNDSTITDTAKVIRGMNGLVTYSWRVRSGNAAGLGAFSAPFAFTTGFPRTPITVYPPPATADVPTHPTFIWNPASAATSYRFQLATFPDYSVIARDTSGITDTIVSLSGLDFYRVYHWRVRATNAVGSSPWSSSSNFRTYTSVEIGQQEGIPSEFELSQNYPNPFNPTTSIQFALPVSQHVTLTVYDILGREKATLIDGQFPVGRYVATWNASSAASGTYFYRLTAGAFTLTKRMILLK